VAADSLPRGIRSCYQAIYTITNEIADMVEEERGFNPLNHLRNAVRMSIVRHTNLDSIKLVQFDQHTKTLICIVAQYLATYDACMMSLYIGDLYTNTNTINKL
jgi:hypothetical protein